VGDASSGGDGEDVTKKDRVVVEAEVSAVQQVLTGAGRGVRAKETDVVDFSIDEVGLEIVESLCGVEAGLVVVIRELGDEAEVQVVRQDGELILVVKDGVHYKCGSACAGRSKGILSKCNDSANEASAGH
jgi:hypothetical protein